MKRIISIVVIGIALAGCNKFEDTNVSPISLAVPTTRGLLTNSIQSLPNLMLGNTAASRTGSLYVQYLSEGPYPGSSLYSERTTAFSTWYTGPLYNVAKIIEYNSLNSPFADAGSNGSSSNQIAVARILKAYFFLQMTDRWGDIPYFNALKGQEAFAPEYDKQEDIYTDLFKELNEANDQIKINEAGVKGDILLDGDMAGWKRFANTTRMSMALRLSKVNPGKGKTEYAAAVADGLISSNAENINYKFIAGDPNNYNPWYNNYSVSFRNDYAISTTMTAYMLPKNDPRLKVYAEVLSGNVVIGLGYGRQTAINIPAAYSRIGNSFRGAGSPLNIYSYAQVLFMEAEAAKLGYTAGGDAAAEEKYKNAIKASWQELGVFSQGAYDTYMTLPDVAYDATNGHKKIITEKWVSMYLKGWEAWNDWRRTGFPALTPAPSSVDARGIPYRQGYPTAESTLNGVNYKSAVTSLGTDDNYAKIWWLK